MSEEVAEALIDNTFTGLLAQARTRFADVVADRDRLLVAVRTIAANLRHDPAHAASVAEYAVAVSEGASLAELASRVWDARTASDEVLGEAGGAEKRVCDICKATVAVWPNVMCCHCTERPWRAVPTASPVPVDASGIFRAALEQIVKNDTSASASHIARKALAAHTAPVADAQAGEGK
jgi:hypothetical protein